MSRIIDVRADAIERLKTALKPGSIIDVRVLSVSRSGMYAHVSAKTLDSDGSWRHLEYNAATAGVGDRRQYLGSHSIGVGGCGFNRCLKVCDGIAYKLGYHLEQTVYQGYAASKKPRSTHMREVADKTARTYSDGTPKPQRTEWKPCKATARGAVPVLYMREG